jgi:predicted DNA-binding transcriptional regulator AlpA
MAPSELLFCVKKRIRSVLTGVRGQEPAPPPDPAGDSVAAFGCDLKERLLSGRYRNVTAFADNYALTGVSRSTVYAAVSGARLPTAATTGKLLGTVVGAGDDEIAAWLVRRADLERPLDPETDAGELGRPVRMVRLRTAVLAVFAAVAGMTVGNALHWGLPQAAPAAARICAPQADLRRHQVVARVANTQGQGTYARLAPNQDCHTGFLPENDGVTVVCQDLHGPVITDVYQGVVLHWPVWDKLGSGAYISDFYTDLPKEQQPTLVDGLPAC